MSYSVAMLSVHTSPLDTPGRTRDAGGMNVYIHELARELGHSISKPVPQPLLTSVISISTCLLSHKVLTNFAWMRG